MIPAHRTRRPGKRIFTVACCFVVWHRNVANAFQAVAGIQVESPQTSAFHEPSTPHLSLRPRKYRNHESVSTSGLRAFDTAIASIDSFYHTQPFLSAFLTASFKASMADMLAQTSGAAKVAAVASTSSDIGSAFTTASDLVSVDPKHSTLARHTIDDYPRINALASLMPEEFMGLDVHRNMAFILYGGLYQGMFLQFQYSTLYPAVFGDSSFRVALQVISDVFIFGPLMTLPLAYILRAALDQKTTSGKNDVLNDYYAPEDVSMPMAQPFQDGVSKYLNHIQTQGLLFQYWRFWGPAQIVNQNFVPQHLRVAFVACVGFFWVILLSAISSQNETAMAPEQEANGKIFRRE